MTHKTLQQILDETYHNTSDDQKKEKTKKPVYKEHVKVKTAHLKNQSIKK